MKRSIIIVLCLLAAEISPARALICLCSLPVHPFGWFKNEASAESSLRSWLDSLKSQATSKYDFYIGKGVDGEFGDLQAVRFLVIVPSEYTRDSQAEWDEFQIILTYQEPTNPAKIWLTTKNYMHRSKGLLSAVSPSPDWEYSTLDDIDTSNTRLEQIASSLKRVAESKSQTLIISPKDDFQK